MGPGDDLPGWRVRQAVRYRGSSDLVDERPVDVILAQLAAWPDHRPAPRLDKPVCARERIRAAGGAERHDAAGLFAFGLNEILVAVHAGQRRDCTVWPGRQQGGAPSYQRRCVAECSDGVSEVVLAIPKRAFAVLPRLTPMNRRERDNHDPGRCVRRPRGRISERRSMRDRARSDTRLCRRCGSAGEVRLRG